MLEYVAVDKRTLVGNLGMAVAFTLSGVYQPWLAKYLGHWKIFNWVIFAQMITIFLVPFLLPAGGSCPRAGLRRRSPS